MDNPGQKSVHRKLRVCWNPVKPRMHIFGNGIMRNAIQIPLIDGAVEGIVGVHDGAAMAEGKVDDQPPDSPPANGGKRGGRSASLLKSSSGSVGKSSK